MWVLFFVLFVQSAIGNNMIYYAYADFASAPLIGTSFILGSTISGVLQLPIAKTLNVWGRAEGYLIFVALYTLGIVLIASCKGPQSFAAGYTIYWIGYTGMNFILSIFVADTVGLRNRAVAYAFFGVPNICTAFTGSLAAQAFATHSTWQWSYGCFAIIVPFVFVPLALVIKYYEKKAAEQGLLARSHSGRSAWQSVQHYFVEFDMVGGCLLMAAFVLILLPFSLESYGYSSYKSAKFIAMLVVGVLLFPVFALWEIYVAYRSPFIKWELLRNRTVLGACLLSAAIFFNYYTWDLYYYYYVEVVYDLDIARSGYMNQVYPVGMTIFAVVFGVYIRQSRHFKKICLFVGAPLMMLGAGLMIYFRGSARPIGLLIMAQIFISIGGGAVMIGDEMAAMAASDREGIPIVIAMISLFASIGGAIGNATATAIYTNVFPQALLRALPDEAKADYLTIYLGGSASQLVYPVGSATRTAIEYAWTEAQKYECIAAAVIVVLMFPGIAVWKDYNIDRRQVKGTVL